MFDALNIEDHSRCVYDYVAVSLTVFHHGARLNVLITYMTLYFNMERRFCVYITYMTVYK